MSSTTRIQKERFADEDEYAKVAGAYKLHASNLDGAKEDMSSAPTAPCGRNSPSVDQTRHARYLSKPSTALLPAWRCLPSAGC